jgi:hypothetical protein
MTPPPNPFTELLDKIHKKLAHARTFIGVTVDHKGYMSIIRDATTCKLLWYPSCAALHTEFVQRTQSNPSQYQGCDFYAISGENYIGNKLLLNLYDGTKMKVSNELFVVFNAIELNFHKQANIGMFMPLQFNLDRLYEKITKDPSLLFEATLRAKDLVLEESKPCTSCGVLCHVPDLSAQPNMSAAALKEILNITSENRHFCFSCGRVMMINMAKYKMVACTDMHKINKVASLVRDLESCELTNSNFDFEKAQSTMKELMSCISKTRMTVVNNDHVEQHKVGAVKEDSIATQPKDIPHWLN